MHGAAARGDVSHVHRRSPPSAEALSIAAITRSVTEPALSRERAGCLDDHLAARHAVALHRVEDVLARHLALHVDAQGPVGRARVPGHAAAHVDDAELAPLDVGVGMQQANDLLGIGALLQLLKNEQMILVRAVHPRLAGGHADPWNHDGLELLQVLGGRGRGAGG